MYVDVKLRVILIWRDNSEKKSFWPVYIAVMTAHVPLETESQRAGIRSNHETIRSDWLRFNDIKEEVNPEKFHFFCDPTQVYVALSHNIPSSYHALDYPSVLS